MARTIFGTVALGQCRSCGGNHTTPCSSDRTVCPEPTWPQCMFRRSHLFPWLWVLKPHYRKQIEVTA